MKKTKTQAFANLIGSLIFIAVGVWALIPVSYTHLSFVLEMSVLLA